MDYQEALRRWGARQIEQRLGIPFDLIDLEATVVEMDFDSGYACCGGTNPDCYCSFATEPSAEVRFTSRVLGDINAPRYGQCFAGDTVKCAMEAADFNFTEVLAQIVAEAGGNVTGPPASRT